MSATDEETRFVNDEGMDHVTYILIMFRYNPPLFYSSAHAQQHVSLTLSIAFVLYTLIISLIGLYSSSGRDSSSQTQNPEETIELAPQPKWYSRVPNGEEGNLMNDHVIGDDEEE